MSRSIRFFPRCLLSRLIVATILSFLGPAFARASCKGPAQIEAKLRSHPSTKTYQELGIWFRDHHQFDCAYSTFDKGFKSYPDSAQLAYLLGQSLYSSGKLQEAITPLQQSIRLDPKALKSYLVLSGVLEQLNRRDEAEAVWRAALAVDAKSAEALDGLTKDLLADNDFRSVIALLHPLNGSVSLTPQRSLDLAQSYVQTGMLEEASETLHVALRSQPASLPLAKALSGVLVMQARKQEAADILESAMKQHPKDVSVRLLYFRLLVLNDEATKGAELGHQLLAEIPENWEVLYLNGVLEQRAGDYAAARDHLEQAVALNPDNVECRQNLGSVLLKLKDTPRAKEQLEKAVSLGSKDPEIRFELAMALRTLGQNQEAEQQLKIYQQQTQAKSDLTQAAAKAALADQRVAAGDFQLAISLYREALAAAPNEASLAYKVAMTFDKAGDVANERTALEQTIQIDPNMVEAHNQLGYLALHAGDTASAEQHFQQALRASPRFTKAWINLAATLFLENKLPEAKDAIAHALELEPGNPRAQQLSQALNQASANQH